MAELSREEMRDRLGNLEQIRELLFGEQSRDYNDRIEKLESDLTRFKREMNDHLAQLHEELSSEIQAAIKTFEKRIKYVSLNAQDETNHLRDTLDTNHKKAMTRIRALDQTLQASSDALKSELSETKEELQSEMREWKKQLDEEIDQYFTQLRDSKVSRDDFAEILFNMCLKVKGSDFLPEAQEEDNDDDDDQLADLLLPDPRSED
jgi:ElaB/YqjD/DUF883 family membrane-anchored ribosome-binding protein